ncbi:MAG: CoA-binding protein [Acidimicrobiales bacterium]|nr:CoA-binding protein [Acidimicrobiaceae bacterium]MXV87885.1 CoA-binding protein [Acidimicrobiales bacterium]MXX43029.1 CoA-binding protein [Acidimicrobiales bacterium]MYB80930.1 CoA-binding protein [Acidimicrobiales bacterium]MYD33577.1 CoA-binding protein [Acidimicrobiales bacterium]
MTITHEPVDGWTEPSAAERLDLIQRTETVAMVGVSANPARPSNFVATYLLSSSTDFDVYFVNPVAEEILGQPCYPSLADLPVVPDLVDVFRRPDDLPGVAAETIDIGAQAFWVQLGLWSPEAAKLAHDAGLDVVMDRCLKIEHARFHGGLHLAGFDTGVVDSRRSVGSR